MHNYTCLFILDRLGVGGSERKTIVAANQLAEKGLSIHMCFLNVTYDLSDTLHASIKHFSVNRRGRLDLSAIRQIRSYLVNHNISVIWAVNLYPTLYMYLSARTIRQDVRLIGSSNISVFRSRYERLKMFIYAPIIRSLDVFVFGSFKQMEQWENKYRLNKKNHEVVHNGVDIMHFSPDAIDLTRTQSKEIFGFTPDDFVIGMVAQFRVEKSYSDLLVACHEIIQLGHPAKLLLVGEGAEEDKIKLLARDLSLENNVCFAGQLDDVRSALIAMDAFVLSSRAVETFSNAALEAMSMGLPAILSNIGGAEEMVKHGVNGYLYAPGDINQLTSCILNLLDKAIACKLGTAGRSIVVENFSSNLMADRYEKIIRGD